MDDPFKTLQELYRKSREAIAAEAADAQRRALDTESQKLDRMHAYEVKQREAMRERQITLNLASSVSILMKLSNVHPEHWIGEVPVYELQGKFRKQEVQTGVRKEIVMEGWELELPQNQERDLLFDKTSGKYLVLTADNNLNNHPPLVWYRSSSRENAKGNVYPLSHTPLSLDDMPWANPFRERRSDGVYYDDRFSNRFARIPATPSETEIDSLKSERWRLSLPGLDNTELVRAYTDIIDNREADYDLYKKADIEGTIRIALARLAAKHGILNAFDNEA